MAIDILIFNAATVDFRGGQFAFTERLAGAGGLAKCRTKNMRKRTANRMPLTKLLNPNLPPTG